MDRLSAFRSRTGRYLREGHDRFAAALAAEAGLSARIRFLLADASSLPFPAGAFGCVAMMDVLHHLADAGPVLDEMARVVAPSGRIVVADFTEEGFALVDRIHREEGKEHPRSTVTVGSAAAALIESGWRPVGRGTGHLQEAATLERPPAA